MDEHVERAITLGLRLRNVNVLTVQEDAFDGSTDSEVFERSVIIDRIIFTHDVDFLVLASRRQHVGLSFPGVIFARQHVVPIGKCIHDLELLAFATEQSEHHNRVVYLPL